MSSECAWPVTDWLLSFAQDYKAEKTIESLKSLTAPESIVIRGGETIKIQAQNLVPGDVVQLETGNIVSVSILLKHPSSHDASTHTRPH